MSTRAASSKCYQELTPVFEQILQVFVEYLFHFNKKFQNRDRPVDNSLVVVYICYSSIILRLTGHCLIFLW
jgi:hypothetical protein